MEKAKLTGRQVVAAVFAGLIGHFLFAAGWVALGLVLVGGIMVAILGGTIGSLGGLLGNPETIDAILSGAGGVLGGWLIGLGIGAVVTMFLGFLFSGLILRGGGVRKPWGTTFTSILITAVLAVPLLLLYGLIAGNAADGQPRFTIVTLIGTAVVGILVWLWMTWAHRGPAAEYAERHATATAPIAGTEPDPLVELGVARPGEEPDTAADPGTPGNAVRKPEER